MDNLKFPTASLKAILSVTPVLSHSYLVVMLLISTIPLITGFLFLWYEKDYSLIPFVLFIILLTISFVGWLKSQKIVDMTNVLPTTFQDKEGNQLATDSRLLTSPENLQIFGGLLQSIGARQPLPEPDGMVDKNGKIIKNSKDEALKKTKNINEKTQKSVNDFIQESIKGNVEIAQTDPHHNKEDFQKILEHNKTGISN